LMAKNRVSKSKNKMFLVKNECYYKQSLLKRGRYGCDRVVVGFTTTCAISAYYY
jgi:hypothetical protein